MKKSILALITMAVLGSGSAMAANDTPVGEQILTWSGPIPALSNVNGGYFINEMTDLQDGTLKFENNGEEGSNKVTLTNASTLQFSVQGAGATADVGDGTNKPFSMVLKSVSVTVNGFDKYDNGYFQIQHNGKNLSTEASDQTEVNTGDFVAFVTVKGDETRTLPVEDFTASDTVMIQALIAIEESTI